MQHKCFVDKVYESVFIVGINFGKSGTDNLYIHYFFLENYIYHISTLGEQFFGTN